jgi:hypothetical protein
MKTEPSPTTYLTIEELTQIAADKFDQAAALAPSYQKEELLRGPPKTFAASRKCGGGYRASDGRRNKA